MRYSEKRKCNLYTVKECADLLGVNEKTVRRALKNPSVYTEKHLIGNAKGKSTTYFIDVHTLGIATSKWTQKNVQLLPSNWTEQVDTTEATGQNEILVSEKDLKASSEEIFKRSNWTQKMSTCSDRNEKDCGVRNLRPQSQTAIKFSDRNAEITPTETAENKKSEPSTEILRPQLNVAVRDPKPEQVLPASLLNAGVELDKLSPILRISKNRNERRDAVRALAIREGVSERSIYRKLKNFERQGLSGLGKKTRKDKGAYRISSELVELVLSALMSNTTNTSLGYIYRGLLRGFPELMHKGKTKISQTTIRRIKNQLEQDPVLRLALYDASQRKEYLRTWNGTVIALHANDLWMMDMTRCDIYVIDPETGNIDRPRIHAIIDAFSGCIVGINFSFAEDQAQTDLAFMRALMPKGGVFAEHYPIYGVPRRMYWDNGKTYTSKHMEATCVRLGIESIHSMAYVSHTRGKIERFFGTLHSFEKTLPGYAGENTAKKDSPEIERLYKFSEQYIAGKPVKERFLTLTEYQNAVLNWLVVEYHQWVDTGKKESRVQAFVNTAPAESLVSHSPEEMFLLFAARKECTVSAGGEIRFLSERWKIPDGTLAAYRDLKVMVLYDQFSGNSGTTPEWLLVTHTEYNGKLRVLGKAVLAPKVAASIQAADQRRADKAVKKAFLHSAEGFKGELANPELTISRQLAKEMPVLPSSTLPLPAAKPTTPTQNITDADEEAEAEAFADAVFGLTTDAKEKYGRIGKK